MSNSSNQYKKRSEYLRMGELAFQKTEKINGEVFSLMYGSLVAQFVKDLDNAELINSKLEKIGYNIGIRLVDEFLAKSGISKCDSFRDTAEVIACVGFKMFLGITAETKDWNPEETSCILVFNENPLADFVELPPCYSSSLNYSNMVCGVIRGALEQLQMQVVCYFVKDILRGDATNEIYLELKERLQEEFFDDDDEEEDQENEYKE
ncbi:Transport protein particle (TRAPP) component family protein [Cryptosporidium meleagridis]|uniref:Trafficking protein particle complex subunit n=1 Tax=Cryptosporidium meleagridis TaxID=93969 RepID=A0A2P4YYG5_9CRYT|nr:Transport protein particle (TRAPP) component family protein [Cryptosporidium meleagridis]